MANKAKAVAEALGSAVDLAKDSSLVKKAESVFGADPAEVAKYRGKSRDMEISNANAKEAEAGDGITTGAVPHPEVEAPTKKVEDLEFEGDVKIPGQKADDVAADATKAEVPAEAVKVNPTRKKNVKPNYFDKEPKKNPKGSIVESGEGFTDASKHMESKVFNDALPQIKSALTQQLKDAGLPLDAASLQKHLTETWKASEKHAKAIITSIKKNDPELLKSTVEAAAKDEATAGAPGFFSKLWSKISSPKGMATTAA